MKKQILKAGLMAFAALFSYNLCFAQVGGRGGGPTIETHHSLLKGAENRQVGAKGTSAGVRLQSVVREMYNNNGWPVWRIDSVQFSYSGGKSGWFDENYLWWYWSFDRSALYLWDHAVNSYTWPTEIMEQSYNATNSCTHATIYDGLYTGGLIPTYREVNTYDADLNLVTKVIEDHDTAHAWIPYYREQYTYTPSRRQETILREEWDATTGVWVPQWRTAFTYDIVDNLSSYITESRDAATGTWANMYRDQFTYDAAGNRTERLTEYWAAGVWAYSNKDIYSDFVERQPRKIMMHVFTGSSSGTRMIQTYNAYNKIASNTIQHLNATTGVWETVDVATRYNYETYTAVTDVAGNDNNGNVTVYPMPATNNTTVRVSWNEPQPTTISIADMQGRVYCALHLPAAKDHKETIAVDKLPAGNYTVMVSGGNSTVARKLTVVK